MGIHQALIGSYALATGWELIDSYAFSSESAATIDPSVTFSNASINDVFVVVVGGGQGGVSGPNLFGIDTNETSLAFRQLASYADNPLNYVSSWAQVRSALVSGEEIEFWGQEGVIGLFRPPISKPVFLGSKDRIAISSPSGTAPSHQNNSVTLQENSLALLSGVLAQDDNTPFSAPGSAVTVDSVYNQGSAMLGYQKINTAGTYSWGQWGTSGTPTDNYASSIAEAFNTDWEIVESNSGTSGSYSLSGLQENDLVVFIGGSDSDSTSKSISQSAGLTVNELVNNGVNSIGVIIATAVIPSTVSSFSYSYTGTDRENTLVIRKQNANSSFTVSNRKETDGSTARDFPVGTVTNLSGDSCVILCCFVDDDGSSTDLPFQGPIGSSLVSQSLNGNRGSNIIAYDTKDQSGSRTYGDFTTDVLSDDYRIIALEIENTATPTWSVVDSDIKQAVGATFSVSNVQAGDFLYFTSTQDDSINALPPTLSGWTVIDSDNDEDPSFKEQYRVATTNEGTVSVTSSGESESGALIVFRCSTGATSLDTVGGSVDGGSGSPQVPSANNGNAGTNAAYSLAVVSGYIDDDEITSVSAPSGLSLAGWASGTRTAFFVFTYRSSLMIGYAVVPNAGTTAPPGAGNTWTTAGTSGVSDQWHGTAFYIKPS